jgi:hypothetical protein
MYQLQLSPAYEQGRVGFRSSPPAQQQGSRVYTLLQLIKQPGPTVTPTAHLEGQHQHKPRHQQPNGTCCQLQPYSNQQVNGSGSMSTPKHAWEFAPRQLGLCCTLVEEGLMQNVHQMLHTLC